MYNHIIVKINNILVVYIDNNYFTLYSHISFDFNNL